MAGRWTLCLLLSGNEAGLTLEEYLAADEATLHLSREKARDRFTPFHAHYLIDTIAELPQVVADIDARLAAGERP